MRDILEYLEYRGRERPAQSGTLTPACRENRLPVCSVRASAVHAAEDWWRELV